MTHLTVSIKVESLEQARADAAIAAERGADLVEFRIDQFIEDLRAIAELVEGSAVPCIVTCRHASEGGDFDGDKSRRLAALEAAAEAGAAYLDVELAAYRGSPSVRERIKASVDHPGQFSPTRTGLILSSHDFDGRPVDLFQQVEAMVSSTACRVIKFAWMARSLRDNLQAFELIVDQHKPTVALCMGEFGLASRVLAPKFGALLTFAGLTDQAVTAPGQVGIQTIRRLYRWDRIDAETRVFGVVGWPVGHSMSPAIHNAGFEAIDFNGVYLPMPIPPAYEHFKATVGAWIDHAGLDFRGASVTIPHKQNLIRFVAERGGQIEPLARRIGAANTLTVRDDGSLYAGNTDYAAALDSVCDAMGIARDNLAERRVAVIGAGGVARAIVAAFAAYGATVVVYNRTAAKAEALAQEFGASDGEGDRGKVVAAPLDRLGKSCCEIYINCTSVGMHPDVDATPMPELPACIGEQRVVFDTIYNPTQTRLLREAADAGAKTINGVQMFVRQGAAQFEQWVAQPAPVDVFEKVMLEQLQARGPAGGE